MHDHPVLGDLDHRLYDMDHHGLGELYQHEDEHHGMDFNRRHTSPLASEIEAPFFHDGQDDFLPHHDFYHHEVHMDGIPASQLVQDNIQDNLEEDPEVNTLTYADYYSHLAGFDQHDHVQPHWVETGNFHMNMMMNMMSVLPGGGPLDPPHQDQTTGKGPSALPH